jgi:predicted AAA+ superfamily ATPase
MKQVRRNVFETNSSSTHSITMCLKTTFEDYKAGRCWKRRFPSKGQTTFAYPEDLTEKERAEIKNKENYDLIVFEDDGSGLDTFEELFKTPSGEEVVAFGYYGYDG